MAATEDKLILGVDVEGLNTLNEFKNALAEIRKKKKDLDVTTNEFKVALEAERKIIEKQNDALGKSKKMVIAAEGSFDALNQQLAELKTQWKATGNEMERAKLTEQINSVKGKINAMNESIGNFQHNVGNYSNAMREVFGGALDAVSGKVKLLNTAFNLLKSNPFLALLGGAALVIKGIVKAIKSSEDAMHRVNVLFAPMRAGADMVLNAMQGLAHKLLSVFEAVGGWIGNIMERLAKASPKFAEWNEKFKASIELQKEANAIEKDSREIAIKNAKDQLTISELRAKANDKEKYSAQERLVFVRQANALELEMSERNKEMAERRLKVMEEEAARAENNAETNEKLAQQQIAVYNAQKEYHQKARELLGQENAILGEIQANAKKVTDIINKGIEEQNKSFQKSIEEKRKANAEWMKEQTEAAQDDLAQMFEESNAEMEIIRNQIKEEQRLKDEAQQKEEERAERKKQITMQSVQAVSSILSSLADIYESNGEADAKAQQKAKNLRIASATIDMLQGAVTAYATAQSLGVPAGPIVGAINAAAVIAAGTANIAKMKKTDTSGNSVSSSAPSIGASVSAPAIIQQVPVTRSLTGASEEERLNQIAENTAKDQRVVLVYSDVEAAGCRVQVQTAETSF